MTAGFTATSLLPAAASGGDALRAGGLFLCLFSGACSRGL
jgi:hypothetical protein